MSQARQGVDAPVPDVSPWPWEEEALVDGESFPANWLDVPDSLTDRFKRTVILRGVPPRFRDELLAAAQASPTPHAWRVGDPLEPEQVDAAVIERARILFARDVDIYASVFLTFLAERLDGSFELLGAAAARRRIGPEYDSDRFVVLSRLLAVPQLRRLGLGKHFTFHFFASSQTLCGPPAVACMMPTETEATRKLCRRAVEGGALDMVPSGLKRWPVLDTVFEVEVYLAFYPGMREWAAERCAAARKAADLSAGVRELLDATDAAWADGYDAAGGARLGALFAEHQAALETAGQATPDLRLYLDFLLAAGAMGTLEGVGQ